MSEITIFGPQNPSDMHECTSYRQGDWITWKCPHCASYERKFNWKTGEMIVNRGNSHVLHTGSSTREQNMESLTRYNFIN